MPLKSNVRRHKDISIVLQRLLDLRPYAFHTCGAINFEAIRRSRTLRSAADMLLGTEHEHLLRELRKTPKLVSLQSGMVEIRDNLPLRRGSVALDADLTFEDFLHELNSRVFLWPGTASGPIATGVAHFEHYLEVGEVRIIRVRLDSLLAANAGKELQVTYCNSGSARHQQGRPVARGRSTFQSLHSTEGRPAKVKELTFLGTASLPPDAEWSQSQAGPWQPL
jgi:hypothetical protein